MAEHVLPTDIELHVAYFEFSCSTIIIKIRCVKNIWWSTVKKKKLVIEVCLCYIAASQYSESRKTTSFTGERGITSTEEEVSWGKQLSWHFYSWNQGIKHFFRVKISPQMDINHRMLKILVKICDGVTVRVLTLYGHFIV